MLPLGAPQPTEAEGVAVITMVLPAQGSGLGSLPPLLQEVNWLPAVIKTTIKVAQSLILYIQAVSCLYEQLNNLVALVFLLWFEF